jgi:hypothetical protein
MTYDITQTDLEFDSLINRMLDLARTGDIIDRHMEQAKIIGRELHRLGGIETMQSAFYVFRGAWEAEPLAKALDIQPAEWAAAWHGIGDWML